MQTESFSDQVLLSIEILVKRSQNAAIEHTKGTSPVLRQYNSANSLIDVLRDSNGSLVG